MPDLKVPFRYVDLAEPGRTQLYRNFEEIQRKLDAHTHTADELDQVPASQVLPGVFQASLDFRFPSLMVGNKAHESPTAGYIHTAGTLSGINLEDRKGTGHPAWVMYPDTGRLGFWTGGTGAQGTRIQFEPSGLARFGIGLDGAYIGEHPVHTQYMGVGHVALENASTDYCLLQHSNGLTILNSGASQPVSIRVGGSTKMTISSTSIASTVQFTAGNAQVYQWDSTYAAFGNKDITDYQIMCRNSGLVLIRSPGSDQRVLLGSITSGWVLEVLTGSVESNKRLNVTGGVHALNDWYRITGTGGIHNESYGDGIRFTANDHIETYGGWARFNVYRHSQAGGWTGQGIKTESNDGGGVGIAFHANGQNSAVILKNWATVFECRNGNDNGYVSIRAASFPVGSRSIYKRNITDATAKVTPERRKGGLKRLRTIHFNRKEEDAYCDNCLGTGRRQPGHRTAEEHPPGRRPPDEITPLESDTALLLLGGDLGPCPSCHGDPASVTPAFWKRQEESGWLGFDVDEMVAEFPEVVNWAQDTMDGEPHPEAIDMMGLVALLWEEVRDLEGRLDKVERLPAVGVGKGGN